jgi:hypothetical protein
MFKTAKPTLYELLAAEAKVEFDEFILVTNPKPTLFEILQAKGKVTFADGSGIEYAKVNKEMPGGFSCDIYLKAITPGGKAWAYPFSQESVGMILLGLGHFFLWDGDINNESQGDQCD